MSRACGVPHPVVVTSDHIEILNDHYGSTVATEVFGCEPELGRPSAADGELLPALMASVAGPAP